MADLDVEEFLRCAVADVKRSARDTGSTYTHVSIPLHVAERAIAELDRMRKRPHHDRSNDTYVLPASATHGPR